MTKRKGIRNKKWRETNEYLGHPRNPQIRPGVGSMAGRKKAPSLFMVGVATGRGWPKDKEGKEIKPPSNEDEVSHYLRPLYER